MNLNAEQIEAELEVLGRDVDSMLVAVNANMQAAERYVSVVKSAQSEIQAKQNRITELRNQLAQLQGALPGETWDAWQQRIQRDREYCV